MKAMWRLINREIGKAPEIEQKLELRMEINSFQTLLRLQIN